MHTAQAAGTFHFLDYIHYTSEINCIIIHHSLMPQKKNPDALELLRGKTGSVIGHLNGFMISLKGLPRSYNKDLQEDKTALFYCVDTMTDCIQIATGVLATLKPNGAAMRSFLVTEMLATDLAEYLVRKGVPFRETHHVAGAAVRLAEDKNKSISDLSFDELKSLHNKFEPDVMSVWNFDASVERKNVPGGTSKESVLAHIKSTLTWLESRG